MNKSSLLQTSKVLHSRALTLLLLCRYYVPPSTYGQDDDIASDQRVPVINLATLAMFVYARCYDHSLFAALSPLPDSFLMQPPVPC